MNIKTSLAIIAMSTSQINGAAQKASNTVKTKIIKTVLNDTMEAECSNLISYKDFEYPNNYYVNTDSIKSINNMTKRNSQNGNIWAKPAAFKKTTPKMSNAEVINADKTKFEYDKFENVSAIYSKQKNKTRTITRGPDGNLFEYTNISYKNGKKNVEEVYNDNGMLVEKRNFHGNKRATVTSYDNNGNPQFEGLYKTKVIDSKEIVP